MPTEYFFPSDQGGSEWSSYYLAKKLTTKGHRVIIFTPNYGTKTNQLWQGIDIYRFPFIGRNTPQGVSPFWHTNIFWFATSLFFLLKLCRKTHPTAIHVQGKYLLPAAVIVGKLLHLPVIFTARDYQIICNTGLCLRHKPRACSLAQYLTSEVWQYLKDYFPRASILQKAIQLAALFRSRLITKMLHWWATKATATVCISHAQQHILAVNGIKAQVIYNTVNFPRSVFSSTQPQLVYVGRLTPGKGADLVIPAFKQAELSQTYRLVIVGSGIFESKLRQQIQDHDLKTQVELVDRLDHSLVLEIYSHSQLAIFPSVWPEPFGRGALEAISQGTPVVTSNRGGLPEIVQDKYGLSVEPTIPSLAQAIKTIIEEQKSFAAQIAADRTKLRWQFDTHPIAQYQRLYREVHK